MGPDFTAFIKTGNSNKTIHAIPLRGSEASHATLYVNESDGVAFLLATGLPPSGPNQHYTLRVDGREVKQFASNGLVAGVHVDGLTREMMASTSWKIVNDAGEVVLSA